MRNFKDIILWQLDPIVGKKLIFEVETFLFDINNPTVLRVKLEDYTVYTMFDEDKYGVQYNYYNNQEQQYINIAKTIQNNKAYKLALMGLL